MIGGRRARSEPDVEIIEMTPLEPTGPSEPSDGSGSSGHPESSGSSGPAPPPDAPESSQPAGQGDSGGETGPTDGSPQQPAAGSAEGGDAAPRARRQRSKHTHLKGLRPLSLRARLIALVLVVAAVALVAVDVVIPLVVHATLMSAKQQTLNSVIENLRAMGPGPLSQQLGTISSQSSLGGEVGWSLGFATGTTQVVQPISSAPHANPAVGWSTSQTTDTVVRDVDRPDLEYLALGFRTRLISPGRGEAAVTIVAWVPLSDVHSTVQRLVILELVISLGLLMLVGGIAGFVVRRELHPLETMAQAADEIAAGDLSRRVTPGAVGTEVGRLGVAFNGMVDGVSALLAERERSENRMRQFVADASHELRTPVAAIRGYTDLYRAGALDVDEAVDRAMERMGFESRRMGALVEDLLTLTQTDAETASLTGDVDLMPLLAGAVDDAAVIDPTRTWRLAGTSARAVVRGDRMRLHQLFANLLGNVRTHTPPGTVATISVSSTPEVVAVAVIDNGPGVEAESLPLLFDRFFRVDKARSREHGGSGLGLSIVAAIVRMHRGRVAATATPGGGLTITVFLPAATSDRSGAPIT